MPDKLKLFVDDARPDWPKRTPDTQADLEVEEPDDEIDPSDREDNDEAIGGDVGD